MNDLPSIPDTHAVAPRRPARLIVTALALTEPVVEWTIRLCGWSAILFVAAIFFFVFREAAPVLFGELNLW